MTKITEEQIQKLPSLYRRLGLKPRAGQASPGPEKECCPLGAWHYEQTNQIFSSTYEAGRMQGLTFDEARLFAAGFDEAFQGKEKDTRISPYYELGWQAGQLLRDFQPNPESE